ncbi:MAG: Ig-like domain-containing protein, partial [Myxococcota bacterium]
MVGLITINGRIKTLKEFFQVTLVLANSSDAYAFEQVTASLTAPDGMTPIRAGLGDDTRTITVDSPIDTVFMGAIGPVAMSGGDPAVQSAQFVVRGDVAGTYRLDLRFDGVITGPGIEEPLAFGGLAQEEVEVIGPPELRVEVVLPEAFERGTPAPIRIRITNLAPIPALYASVEIDLDPNLYPIRPEEGCFADIDANTGACCGALQTVQFELGHLEPGQATERVVEAMSCISGPVTACAYDADENLQMEVVTGVTCPGTSIPIDRAPALEFAPPTVVDFAPVGSVPVDQASPIRVTLTGPIANARADTLTNVQTDPNDPEIIIAADVAPVGTLFIDRMDPGGTYSLERIPAVLGQQPGALANTTELTLTPGIDGLGGLEPGQRYRVTVRGGSTGIRSADTGEPMTTSFVWSFSTEPAPVMDPLEVESIDPTETQELPVWSIFRVTFNANLDPSTFTFAGDDYRGWSIALVREGIESDGDLMGGDVVDVSLQWSNDRTLTVTPNALLDNDTLYQLRIGTNLARLQMAQFKLNRLERSATGTGV